MGKLFAPNGAQIIGTLEHIPGVAGILDVTLGSNGEFEVEGDSETTVDWDGQQTETYAETGARIFVDEHNETWPEYDLTFKESEDA